MEQEARMQLPEKMRDKTWSAGPIILTSARLKSLMRAMETDPDRVWDNESRKLYEESLFDALSLRGHFRARASRPFDRAVQSL